MEFVKNFFFRHKSREDTFSTEIDNSKEEKKDDIEKPNDEITKVPVYLHVEEPEEEKIQDCSTYYEVIVPTIEHEKTKKHSKCQCNPDEIDWGYVKFTDHITPEKKIQFITKDYEIYWLPVFEVMRRIEGHFNTKLLFDLYLNSNRRFKNRVEREVKKRKYIETLKKKAQKLD